MVIRRAGVKDIDGILALLSQVLEVHAAIRPDLFITGNTKYTGEELTEIIKDDNRPIYVALEEDVVIGYAFCVHEEEPAGNCTYAKKEVYLDDLCVDESVRGKDVAKQIYEYVKSEAKKQGFDYLTLNVWEGNVPAEKFYQKMGMTPRKTMMECKL